MWDVQEKNGHCEVGKGQRPNDNADNDYPWCRS